MAIGHPARVARAQTALDAPVQAGSSGLSLRSASALDQVLQRRRARLLKLVAATVVAGALLVVVVGQAMVASQQVHIDNLHAELSSAVNANENLQLTRAQLEAPGRILILAQHQLHMIVPKTVTYLNPVGTGPSVSSVQSGAKS